MEGAEGPSLIGSIVIWIVIAVVVILGVLGFRGPLFHNTR